MGQRIVQLAVSVEIPGVIEKYEIARTDVRSSMKGAMLPHMVVDEPDAILFLIIECSPIQINAVLQEDGTGDPCTIISDTFARLVIVRAPISLVADSTMANRLGSDTRSEVG